MHNLKDQFIEFFRGYDHLNIPSSSVIINDPNLLFVNAGMVQFKDYFSLKSIPPHTSLTSIQKCIRISGKHNDLDIIGHSDRHFTFFEMMGNFSIGKYTSKETIKYIWNFLNFIGINMNKVVIGISPKDKFIEDECRLYTDNILYLPPEECFWSMGEQGVCGPCFDIMYYTGKETIEDAIGKYPETDNDLIEIWSIVLMEHNRINGQLLPLSVKGIDTGASFERISAILQNVPSVYHIDTIKPLFDYFYNLTGNNEAAKVCTDHLRCVLIMLSDGLRPISTGRGYVMRKLIRRAIMFYSKFTDNLILHKGYDIAVQLLSQYPLTNNHTFPSIIREEERIFWKIIKGKDNIISNYISSETIEYKDYYYLYETHGMPFEITYQYAMENQLSTHPLESVKDQYQPTPHKKFTIDNPPNTIFHYDKVTMTSIITDVLPQDDGYWVFVMDTPFYGESGGQISDKGIISWNDQEYTVDDVQIFNGSTGHKIRKPINIGGEVILSIDVQYRKSVRNNHSLIHILNSIIMEDYNGKQWGSKASADKFRLDVNTPTKPNKTELQNKMNKIINTPWTTTIQHIPLEDISQYNIKILENHVYPPIVRVVEFKGDNWSARELCCGTHVTSNKDLYNIEISSVKSIGNSIYRIEGIKLQQSTKINKTKEEKYFNITNTYTHKDFQIIEVLSSSMKDMCSNSSKFQNIYDNCIIIDPRNYRFVGWSNPMDILKNACIKSKCQWGGNTIIMGKCENFDKLKETI